MFNPVGNAIPSRPVDLSTPDHSLVQREQPVIETSSQRSLPEVIEAASSCSSSSIQQATAINATKKKKKKKKKKKAVSTPKTADLTKIYYDVIVNPKEMNRSNCPCCAGRLCDKEIEVYRVPLSLLPHQVQAELLNRGYKEDKEIPKETSQERLKRLSKQQFDNKPVIEVTSLTPIRFTQFGKATPKAFIEKFGCSFQVYLQKIISEKFTSVPPSSDGSSFINRTIPEGKYVVYSAKTPEIKAESFVELYETEEPDQVVREHKQISNQYLIFLKEFLKWAEEKQAFPYDLNIIDTLICLNVDFIRSGPLSQQNTKILIDVLASNWTEIRRELHYFKYGSYSEKEVPKECVGFAKCQTFLKRVLAQVENFFSEKTVSHFRREHKEEIQRFLSSLKRKNDHFIKWLQLGANIKAISSANFYYSHFKLLQSKTLDDISHCYLKAVPVASVVDWEKNRTTFLLTLLSHIQKENQALYTMLLPFLLMLNRGFEEDNFMLGSIYLDKIQQIIVKQIFNRDDYEKFQPYVGDIESNFLIHDIISLINFVKFSFSSVNGNLIKNREAEVAALLEASKLNFSSIQSSTFLPIINWSNSLFAKGHLFSEDIKQLFMTITQLQKICLSVKEFENQLFFEYAVNYFTKEGVSQVEVVEYLKNSHEKSFSGLMRDLIANKKMNLIHKVYDCYLTVYQTVEKSLKLSLEIINPLITNIQSSAFLHLLENDENQLSVEELRQQFEAVNSFINGWVVPTINYVNASIDFFSFKTNQNVKQKNKLQFCGLSINLFNTKQKMFDTFAEKLSLIQEEQKRTQAPLEIIVKEEPASEKISDLKGKESDVDPKSDTSSLKKKSLQVTSVSKDQEISKKREAKGSQSPLSTSPPDQELHKKLHSILKGTTQQILSELNQLIKKHQASKELIFGKGSHMKLYINGHMVLIPKHRTLKRGTADDIQKSIVTALEGVTVRES